jgi:hypothetical protein
MIRIFFNILVFLSVFLTNWWVLLILIILGNLYFEDFYEALIWALLFDIVYGTKSDGELFSNFKIFIYSILVTAVTLVSKKYLKFY